MSQARAKAHRAEATGDGALAASSSDVEREQRAARAAWYAAGTNSELEAVADRYAALLLREAGAESDADDDGDEDSDGSDASATHGASTAAPAVPSRALLKAAPLYAFDACGPTGRALAQLLLLLIQRGSCDDDVWLAMKKMGFIGRLSDAVLRYRISSSVADTPADTAPRPFVVTDDALDGRSFRALRAALVPGDASYWTAHNYSVDPPSPFFSYVLPIDPPAAAATNPTAHGAIGALVAAVVRAAMRLFPDKAGTARFAEVWAHNRPHASGHQLHFDSDDEGRGGIRNPLCGSIVYLTEGVGGPSLMTNQRFSDDALATRGWLVHPRRNRVMVFDGTMLHGVVPGRGPPPAAAPDARRVTVMCALWASIETRRSAQPGSARPLPDAAAVGAPQWARDLTAKDAGDVDGGGALQSTRGSSRVVVPTEVGTTASLQGVEGVTAVKRVWSTPDGCAALPSRSPMPPYTQLFQGF